jgi:hypothetical protein
VREPSRLGLQGDPLVRPVGRLQLGDGRLFHVRKANRHSCFGIG